MYNEASDTVEWIQEEIEDLDVAPIELTVESISKLSSEDVDAIMLDKDYAKA